MSQLKSEQIESLLKIGESFSLTESQYEEKTGQKIPHSSKSYLLHRSAIARLAQQYGYEMTAKMRGEMLTETEITFEKKKLENREISI